MPRRGIGTAVLALCNCGAAVLFLTGCMEDSGLPSKQLTAGKSKEQRADPGKSSRGLDASDALPQSGTPQPQSKRVERAKQPNASGTGARVPIGNQGPLSIEIDFTGRRDSWVIDINEPFLVVLTNRSDQAIRIGNPHIKTGYYQLSFEFTNTENGAVHVVRKRRIEDDGFWKLVGDEIEPGSETIEIEPKGDFAFQVLFSDFKWGKREWTGFPGPNSSRRFSISAQFESTTRTSKADQPTWIGQIRSNQVMAKLVARRLKTPHEYLWSGFPGRAIGIMKADPKWIARRDDNSRTPLHIAARFGHRGVVEWLLNNGADVDDIAYNGFTPLHLTRHPEVIALIFESKPDLSICCRIQGQTPLQRAIANLVRARDEKEKREWQHIVDLYLGVGAEYDLLTAIHSNDLDRVKSILNETPEVADEFQEKSPLRTAASLGKLEICRYLVERHQVDVDDFERGVGYPIIKEALAHPEVVRLLIENGADLETRITWRGGRTGVWFIGDDATALHFAARDGVPETIRLLVDHGVDIFATANKLFEDNANQTALEVAAFFGKAENASAIINHPKFDEADEQQRKKLLNKCLVIGAPPTWLAREADRPKLVESLLKKGADSNARQESVSAIQIAARQIQPTQDDENREIKKIISILVEHGATLDLFSAVALGDEAQVARLLRQNPELANSRGPDGYPALHMAVAMDFRNLVKQLLDADGDVEIRNKSEGTSSVDATPLHCAAFWGRYEIAKHLINAGAEVNALTQEKSTPLHSAARLAHVRIAQLLLENGAKIDAQDKDGKTPLDWSRNWRRIKANADEIEKLFREHSGERED